MTRSVITLAVKVGKMSEYPVAKFTFAGSAVVRCVVVDGESWTVVADICTAIEVVNPAQVTRLLDDDEKGIYSVYTL